MDEVGLNLCGGCGDLGIDDLSEPCGECGAYECSPDGSVVNCVDPGLNACNNCGVLEAEPGTDCLECGTWVCDPEVGVVCVEDRNICGGCEPIPVEDGFPGAACGDCGALVCAPDQNGLVCADPGLNACGGCGLLEGQPDDFCGECGRWTCSPDNTEVTCEGTGPRNLCDGCEVLDGIPGEECAGVDCPGFFACTPDGGLTCLGGELNACGGCGILSSDPGDACGACGIAVCDGEELICDDPGSNFCGGCTSLDADPDTGACGQCGLFACDGTDAGECIEFVNPCGGCGVLDGTLNSACGDCGVRVCDPLDLDATLCEDPGFNVCGGCLSLDGLPGDSCGVAGCGELVCLSPIALSCIDAPTNPCGGCEPLFGAEPGQPCGACPDDAFTCVSENELECTLAPRNECLGCAELPFAVGETCPCGTPWECKGTESLTCEGLNACGGCTPIDPGLLGTFCNAPNEPCAVWQCNAEGDGLDCVPTGFENECGGCVTLPAGRKPGDPCECDSNYVCFDGNSTICPGVNVCGGCEPIANPELLGTPCNEEEFECGTIRCNADASGFECVNEPVNDCGGCGFIPASQRPGQPCACGVFTCELDRRSTYCPGENECGGCEALTCPLCDAEDQDRIGRFEPCTIFEGNDPDTGLPIPLPPEACALQICSGENELACTVLARNECGGCTPLSARPGDQCPCGLYVCAPDGESVICPGENACGGCTDIENESQIGENCDDLVDPDTFSPELYCNQFACNEQGTAVTCRSFFRNSCLGCAPLAFEPLTACSDEGCWICATGEGSESVLCEDPCTDPCFPINECGGCGELGVEIGSDCGSDDSFCRTWTCGGPEGETPVCAETRRNACGGCGTLSDPPGQACGTNGCFVCAGTDFTFCEDPCVQGD